MLHFCFFLTFSTPPLKFPCYKNRVPTSKTNFQRAWYQYIGNWYRIFWHFCPELPIPVLRFSTWDRKTNIVSPNVLSKLLESTPNITLQVCASLDNSNSSFLLAWRILFATPPPLAHTEILDLLLVYWSYHYLRLWSTFPSSFHVLLSNLSRISTRFSEKKKSMFQHLVIWL